jgi:hypothetical protein
MVRTIAVTIAAFLALVAVGFVPSSGAPSGAAPSKVGLESTADVVANRDPDVPDLPFPDNPDPAACGIPEFWRAADDRGWLTGVWEGELVQPEVFLYEGHLRLGITGSAAHGAEVRIVMHQSNPALDYYLVEVVGRDDVRGWVPAPFLSLDPVDA